MVKEYAFPKYGDNQYGMSLRMWLAAQALPALITQYEPMTEDAVSRAFVYADKMIEFENKDKERTIDTNR